MTAVDIITYYLSALNDQIGLLSFTTLSILIGYVIGFAFGVMFGRATSKGKKKEDTKAWDDIIKGGE